jgi:hypothetical protein
MKDELMESAEIVVEGLNDVVEGEPLDVVALAMLIFVTEFIAEIAPTMDEAMKGLDGLTKDVANALKEYYADNARSH